MESRDRLGPRPQRGRETIVEADVDVRIYPVHSVGKINYEMLFS
jgi:hypothetical protein